MKPELLTNTATVENYNCIDINFLFSLHPSVSVIIVFLFLRAQYVVAFQLW